MTEAEWAWEAYARMSCGYVAGWQADNPAAKAAFLAGWKRVRATAEKLVVEGQRVSGGAVEFFKGGTLVGLIADWSGRHLVPVGTRIRVTVEEIEEA